MLFMILLIPILTLVVIFIQALMSLALSEKRRNYDPTKENNDRAKDKQKDCKSSDDLVFSTVQVEQEIKEKTQGEPKTVTVTIDKIPYEYRHLICFDCEYCYSPKLRIKECSRRTQKIVWNPVSKKGYCTNREENED